MRRTTTRNRLIQRQACPDQPFLRMRKTRQPDKIAQQLQPDILALLGMKLGRKNILLPDRRGKCFTVGRARGGQRRIFWLRKKTVNEVDVASVSNLLKQGAVWLGQFEPIPSDLRD